MKKLILLYLLLNNTAFADIIFNYNAHSHLKVGAGIDIEVPHMGKRSCYENVERQWLDCNEACSPVSKVEIKYINTFKELIKELKIDMSIQSSASFSAKISGFGGGADSNYKLTSNLRDYQKHQESRSLVIIKAYSDFGRQELKSYKLLPRFQNLLNENKFDEFRNECGTHFVHREKKKSMITGVIEIKNINSNIKRHLKTYFETEMKSNLSYAEVLSGNASSKFTSDIQAFLEEANKMGSLEMSLTAHGGTGLTALGSVISNATSDDFKSLLSGMSSYVTSMSAATSPSESYYLIPYSTFESAAPTVKYGPKRFKWLNKLFDLDLQVQGRIERLGDIAENTPELFETYYSSEQAYYKKIQAFIESLATDCIKNNICEEKNLQLAEILWPNDLLINNKLMETCHYTDLYSEDGSKKIGKILSEVSLSVRGELPFLTFTNTDTLNVFYFDSKSQLHEVDNRQVSWVIKDINKDSSKYFARIDHVKFDLKNLGLKKVKRTQKLINEISQSYKETRKNSYIIEAQDLNNFTQKFRVIQTKRKLCPVEKKI